MSSESGGPLEGKASWVFAFNSCLNGLPRFLFFYPLSFVLCLSHLLFSSLCDPALGVLFECGPRRALK